MENRRPTYPTMLALCFITTTGCTSITTVRGACGTGVGAHICMGDMSVPTDDGAAFIEASRLAIDAVHAQSFVDDLQRFRTTYAMSGPHARAWADVDVAVAIPRLRAALDHLTAETYGGPYGLVLYVFKGNLAFDGTTSGPIRLNRWGLPRSSPSLANSIVHEAAHRIGLEHPNSDTRFAIARCEPPYVIGTLAERYATGTSWKPSADDCDFFLQESAISDSGREVSRR